MIVLSTAQRRSSSSILTETFVFIDQQHEHYIPYLQLSPNNKHEQRKISAAPELCEAIGENICQLCQLSRLIKRAYFSSESLFICLLVNLFVCQWFLGAWWLSGGVQCLRYGRLLVRIPL